MLYLSQSRRLIGARLSSTNLRWKFRYLGAGIRITGDVAGQRSASTMNLNPKQQICICNLHGIDFLKEFASFKEELAAEKLCCHQRIVFLKDQLAAMELARSSREARIRWMKSGNERVFAADAEVDATLYDIPQGRNDPEVFKNLYGLLPETVRNISGWSCRLIPLPNLQANLFRK